MLGSRLGKVITVSKDIAQKVEHVFNVPDSKVQVIHSSVDILRYADSTNLPPPAELAQLRERPVVLTVARLDQQKGLTTLLEAAAQVPEAVFVLVGEGPQRAALERQCQELNLQNRVLFTGFRQDIRAWLAHCDLFVLPSLYEGLPIALLEAMAAGKPVIASAIPGNLEAVTHGETGWSFRPGDANDLASAIRFLLADPALAQRLASAGQSHVNREFSCQRMNEQVMQVYERLLKQAREGQKVHV
jgi:glycosyltransferase involved in cell wall biosynthesis